MAGSGSFYCPTAEPPMKYFRSVYWWTFDVLFTIYHANGFIWWLFYFLWKCSHQPRFETIVLFLSARREVNLDVVGKSCRSSRLITSTCVMYLAPNTKLRQVCSLSETLSLKLRYSVTIHALSGHNWIPEIIVVRTESLAMQVYRITERLPIKTRQLKIVEPVFRRQQQNRSAIIYWT